MAQREVQVQRSLQEFFRPDHDHPFPVLLPNGDGQDGSLTVRDRNMVVKRLHQLREAQSETNLCYTLVQHRHQRQTRLLGELNLVQRQLCQRSQWLQRGDMLLVTPDSSSSSSSSAWSGHGNGCVAAGVGTGSGATGGDCEWSHVGEFECGSGCVVAGCGCEGDESATEGKSACKGQATGQSNLPYCLSECQQHTITTITATATSSSSTATSVAGSFIAADTDTDADADIDKENVLPEGQGEAGELVGTGGPCQQDCVRAGAGAGLCQDEPYDHTLCSDCSVVCDLAHDCVRRLRNMQVGNRWGDSYE